MCEHPEVVERSYRTTVWLRTLPIVLFGLGALALTSVAVHSQALLIVTGFVAATWTLRSCAAWSVTYTVLSTGVIRTNRRTSIDLNARSTCRYFPFQGTGKTLDVAVFVFQGRSTDDPDKLCEIDLPRYGFTRSDRVELFTQLISLIDRLDVQISDATRRHLTKAANQ
jgi:hypothetical protein